MLRTEYDVFSDQEMKIENFMKPIYYPSLLLINSENGYNDDDIFLKSNRGW